ncbi:MAG: hypothetical protein NVS2B14_00290 [Chamaesiphon sp.]
MNWKDKEFNKPLTDEERDLVEWEYRQSVRIALEELNKGKVKTCFKVIESIPFGEKGCLLIGKLDDEYAIAYGKTDTEFFGRGSAVVNLNSLKETQEYVKDMLSQL